MTPAETRSRSALSTNFAWELLVLGQPLRVRVCDPISHGVEPSFELVVAARPDLDPGWRHSLALALEGMAEHVLERCQPIAAFGQQRADRGVGEVRELDLHVSAAGGERPLDVVEGGRARHTAEAESRDLVERRTVVGEARHPAGNRDYESR